MTDKFNTEQDPSFRQWGILELMGHRRLAGLVSEMTIAGVGFLRIDIPKTADKGLETDSAVTQIYSPSSVYCFTALTGDWGIDGRGHTGSNRDRAIHWVIVGGESGPRARPLVLAWVRDVVRQCREAGVPMFVKQMGFVWATTYAKRDMKGGDMSEWPEDLRVREWPKEQQHELASDDLG